MQFLFKSEYKIQKKNTKKITITIITIQKPAVCLNFLIQYEISSTKEIHCIAAMRKYTVFGLRDPDNRFRVGET